MTATLAVLRRAGYLNRRRADSKEDKYGEVNRQKLGLGPGSSRLKAKKKWGARLYKEGKGGGRAVGATCYSRLVKPFSFFSRCEPQAQP